MTFDSQYYKHFAAYCKVPSTKFQTSANEKCLRFYPGGKCEAEEETPSRERTPVERADWDS